MSSVAFCKFAQTIPPMFDNAALYTPAVVQPSVVEPMAVPTISNDQITEDILTVVDKLSDKFNETFRNVTDPEVYARINNTLQQMDPADLARIGAMLGGGLVGFRRALAGDSPGAVLKGVITGATLGAAGGYVLPKILDSLVGVKTAALLGPVIRVLSLIGTGVAIDEIIRSSLNSSRGKGGPGGKSLGENPKENILRGGLNKNSFNVNLTNDFKFLLGGFSIGSLLGFLYSRFKKKEDSEEESSALMPTLVGGSLGTLAGLLANWAFTNNTSQIVNK